MAQPVLRVVTTDEETGAGKPLMIPLSRLHRYEGQPRRYFNKKEIAELADDIQLNGQETPNRVFPMPDKPGHYMHIGGGRRERAFILIGERTGTDPLVKCVLGDVRDAKDHFKQAFRDNIKRKGYLPRELADAYQQMYDDSERSTHEEKIYELMREAGESQKHIEEHLLVASLPTEAKDLMIPDLLDKQLVFKVALQIARSTTDPALRLRLAKETSEACMVLHEARIYIREQTGHTSYGQSGRPRVASDEYATFRRTLGSVKDRLGKVQETWDVVGLYQARPDPDADRLQDAATIRGMIAELQGLLQKVSGEAEEEQETPETPAPKPAPTPPAVMQVSGIAAVHARGVALAAAPARSVPKSAPVQQRLPSVAGQQAADRFKRLLRSDDEEVAVTHKPKSADEKRGSSTLGRASVALNYFHKKEGRWKKGVSLDWATYARVYQEENFEFQHKGEPRPENLPSLERVREELAKLRS